MADPRSERRHLPADRGGQPADPAAAVSDIGTRQVGVQPALERGLNWPWLLADRGILTVSCLVAGLGALGLIMMWLIANRLHGADRANLEIDAVKYGLGFIAAGGAAAALLLSVRRQQLAERSHDLELRKQTHVETDAADRRVTELFTKAVEQLGSGDAAVRLGGLYALERVAQNNPGQRQTVVDVICAYLRMPYNPSVKLESAQHLNTEPTTGPSPSSTDAGTAAGRDPRQELQVRLTAQRILTRHLRRPDRIEPTDPDPLQASPSQLFWPHIDLDLTGAALVDWTLDNCKVRSAGFDGAIFAGNAGFGGAIFGGNAGFDGAIFTGRARFGEAVFTGKAGFGGAIFTGPAWFGRAAFTGYTSFSRATFTGRAVFDRATFTNDTLFRRARFTDDAEFNEMRFTGHANFAEATFSGRAVFGMKAIFTNGATFNKATFTGESVFDGATFGRGSDFEDATFTGDAHFFKATFAVGSSFLGCRVERCDERRDDWPSGWRLMSRNRTLGRLVPDSLNDLE